MIHPLLLHGPSSRVSQPLGRALLTLVPLTSECCRPLNVRPTGPLGVFLQHRYLPPPPYEDHLSDSPPQVLASHEPSHFTHRSSINGSSGLSVGLVTCLRIQSTMLILPEKAVPIMDHPAPMLTALHLEAGYSQRIHSLLCHGVTPRPLILPAFPCKHL